MRLYSETGFRISLYSNNRSGAGSGQRLVLTGTENINSHENPWYDHEQIPVSEDLTEECEQKQQWLHRRDSCLRLRGWCNGGWGIPFFFVFRMADWVFKMAENAENVPKTHKIEKSKIQKLDFQNGGIRQKNVEKRYGTTVFTRRSTAFQNRRFSTFRGPGWTQNDTRMIPKWMTPHLRSRICFINNVLP